MIGKHDEPRNPPKVQEPVKEANPEGRLEFCDIFKVWWRFYFLQKAILRFLRKKANQKGFPQEDSRRVFGDIYLYQTLFTLFSFE